MDCHHMIRVVAVFSITRIGTCSTWLSFLLPFSMSKLRRNVIIASPGFMLVYLLGPIASKDMTGLIDCLIVS